MTYKQLLIKTMYEYGTSPMEFDPAYTVKHLTVSEVFNDYDLKDKEWNDEV